MVVCHCKSGQGEKADGFLFESTAQATNEVLIKDLVEVWNLRIRVKMLANSVRQLAEFGPMKPPNQQGLDEVEDDLEERGVDLTGERDAGGVYETKAATRSQYYKPDPSGFRTGNAPQPQLAKVLLNTCSDAEKVLDQGQIQRRENLTAGACKTELRNLKGAVMIAFPGGLPAWDTVRMAVEAEDKDSGPIQGIEGANELLDPLTATLWFAGKEMQREKLVKDYVGRHEKTRFKARLQRSGSGAPAREPAISENERKSMMAHYFKKQQEMKKLAENDEDDYLHSSWADSGALQSGLRGMGSIKAPGIQ